MSDAPERIWVSPWKTDYSRSATDIGSCSYIGDALDGSDPDGSTEYIRADLSDALVAAETQFAFKAGYAVAGSDTPYSSTDEAYRDWRDPDTRTALDDLLKAERERALREAADVCTYVIKNYDVMEPGKPDQFASLKTQKAAKGMVSLARQDIEALIKKDATDG